MIQRILSACGHFACTHYLLVLVLAVIITLLSLIPPFYTIKTGSGFSASLSKMMPEENMSAQAFSRAINDFGAADEVYVLFRVQNDDDVAAVGEYTIEIAEALRKHPDFQDAYCQYIRPEEKGFLQEELLARGLLYLPPEGIAEVKEKLTRKPLARAVKRTADALFAASGHDEKAHLILLKELGLDAIFRKHMATAFRSLGEKNSKTALMAAKGDKPTDDTIILIAAQPKGPAQRIEYSARIMQIVRDEVIRITGEDGGADNWVSESVWYNPTTWNAGHKPVAGKMPPALARGVKVQYAGGYEVAIRYVRQIQESLASTLLTSLIGVLCLFGYCYRRYGVMFYVGLPLIMAVCWTMGAGWLIFGKLNMISCSFAAVLVGLGVDYGIHIYNRYIEERGRGLGVEESFVLSLSHTGSGVVIGMFTTAMSFMALMVTRFKGLSQFGTLAGVGLALALPAMIFVMPALVIWRSKRGKGEHNRALNSTTFFLPSIVSVVKHHTRKVAFVGILLAAASGAYVLVYPDTIRFDERLSSLRPTDDPIFSIGKEIAERFSRKSPARQMVLVTGATEAEAMNNAADLLPKLNSLREDNTLHDFELLNQFLPAPEEQVRRRAAINEIDFAAASRILRQQLEKRALAAEPFEPIFGFFQSHRELAENGDTLLPTDFRDTPAWRLLHRLVGRHRIYYRVDKKREPSVWTAFDEDKELVLAEMPSDRDGHRFFTAGSKVTPEALTYLATTEIDRLQVTPDRNHNSPAVEMTFAKLRTELAAEKTYYYAEDIKGTDGLPLLAPGTVMTPPLARFLWDSNCSSIMAYGEGWSILAYIYPPVSELNNLELTEGWVKKVRQRLGADDKKILLTGTMIVAHDLANVVKEDFRYITLAVGLIAAIVLLVCFRNVAKVAFSLAPILFALLYLIGIMAIGNIYFNFINVLVVPIIIGLGVDNGIHLVHRYYESDRDIQPMVANTGKAIVITNLTSMVGFGSMYMGSYKGLTSMGMLSVLGLGLSLFASLVVLPSLLQLLLPKKK